MYTFIISDDATLAARMEPLAVYLCVCMCAWCVCVCACVCVCVCMFCSDIQVIAHGMNYLFIAFFVTVILCSYLFPRHVSVYDQCVYVCVCMGDEHLRGLSLGVNGLTFLKHGID